MENEKQEKDKTIFSLKGGLMKREKEAPEKSKMFDMFNVNLDDYSDIQLTYDELNRVRMQALKLKHGFQAMAPIYCLGPKSCPFIKQCPFVDITVKDSEGNISYDSQDIKKFPLARPCPIEASMIAYKIQAYAEEFEIDTDSPSELGLICKLAEIDLYDYRTTRVLASADEDGDGMSLMKKQISGFTPKGDEIVRLEEHPAFMLKEKLHRQRMDILNALVGTRKEKYKKEAALKIREGNDASTVQADLLKKIEKLNSESVVDAEFEEIENKEFPEE